jgi:hypothetical protein
VFKGQSNSSFASCSGQGVFSTFPVSTGAYVWYYDPSPTHHSNLVRGAFVVQPRAG